MADFRRCLYALAIVALLAGITVPASAQSFQCTNSLSSQTNVRAEGYSELLGDIVLDCTGGVPTPVGQPIPTVTIQVNLDVNVTSRVTAVLNQVEFLESLLIIDEPNTAGHATVPILNCGRTAAPDNTQAGVGVCAITGLGQAGAANTYDGTQGRPNVFQGRSFGLITGAFNQVVFSGIPVDPPGTNCPNQASQPVCHRIFRITNVRGDATAKSVVVANVTQSINATLIVNPFAGLPIDSLTHAVASVSLGLAGTALTRASGANNNIQVAGGQFAFVQCTALGSQFQLNNVVPVPPSAPTAQLTFTFQEGFNSAFKPLSLTQTLNNGVAKPSYNYFGSGTAVAPLPNAPNTSQVVTHNQNVPGAQYDSESGFTNSYANGDNPVLPLTGAPPGNGNTIFTNVGGTAVTGIDQAGIATQATRLIVSFSGIPAGSVVSAPNVVLLQNVIANTTIGSTTGVAVLITGTTATGFGGTPVTTLTGTTPVGGIVTSPGVAPAPTANYAVYEVFFANPSALEKVAIPLTVTGNPNLASALPAAGVTSQIQGSFAPFYEPIDNVRRPAYAAGTENTAPLAGPPAILAIPRFLRIAVPVDFYAISRCSCNLLFPFVTNAATAGGNFDTSIAIANTSLDPGNAAPTVFGFRGAAQAGPVQLWYYNKNTTATEPNILTQGNTQCTNATTPGSCAGTLANVPAGGLLVMSLSSGGSIDAPVLQPVPGFTGYMIAQARFQYCHGFAYISKAGAGFQADNMAMGYLALVMDAALTARTSSLGETLGN